MNLTPLQKRAERKARNHTGLDMNLVSLIDIFTILIFFLMSSTGIELLATARAVKLPESTADKLPRQTLVVTVTGSESPAAPGPKDRTSPRSIRISRPPCRPAN